MAAPITIGIAADANDFARGIKSGVVTPLEGVADVYNDLRDASKKSGDTLERTLKDQQSETQRLRKDYDKLGEEIKGAGRKGRDFGSDVSAGTDDVTRGLGRAQEGVDDFRDEANSTAKEVAASFDGSAESITGGFQEVAANAFAGFGPAGAVTGLIAAGVIGTFLSGIQQAQDAADELRAKFSSLYQEAAEEGNAYLSAAQVQSETADLLFNPDRANEWKQVQADAKALGVDQYDLASALSGDQQKMNDLLGYANDKHADTLELMKQQGGIQFEQSEAENGAIGRLQERQDLTKQLADQSAGYLDYQARKEADNDSARKRSDDAATARLQGQADKLAGIPPKTVSLNVDTSPADRQIETFKAIQRSLTIVVNAVDAFGKKIPG